MGASLTKGKFPEGDRVSEKGGEAKLTANK